LQDGIRGLKRPNLAASHYRPRVVEEVIDEAPKELIREVRAIEQEPAEGMQELLQEIET
jgi:hypothetical protein